MGRLRHPREKLAFTSDGDPGIAIDRTKDIGASGPCGLTFRLKGPAGS